MMELLKNITLSNLGNAASIVALFLTFLIFINMRKIKRFYVFTARVPELLEKLANHASKISAYQKDFSSSTREIKLLLAETEILLKSIKSKVGTRQIKSSVKRVLKIVTQYNPATQDQDALWTVYVEIQKLVSEIQEFQSDLKWRQ